MEEMKSKGAPSIVNDIGMKVEPNIEIGIPRTE